MKQYRPFWLGSLQLFSNLSGTFLGSDASIQQEWADMVKLYIPKSFYCFHIHLYPTCYRYTALNMLTSPQTSART